MLTDNFDKMFYNSVMTVREFDVVLKFGDDYQIEKAALDFLDSLGFRITDVGYKYLVRIIHESVKLESLFPHINRWYVDCADFYSVTENSVETAISNAIKNAGKSGKLRKMNDIFNNEYVVADSISNAMFITAICRRFNMSRKYDREIRFRA